MTRLTVRPASIAALLGGAAAASIVGSADAQSVLSNLSAYTGPTTSSFYYSAQLRAISFTTGNGSWSLQQVMHKGFASFVGTMQIWSNLAGEPDSVFATSETGVGGIASTEVSYAFTGVTLAANTTYWMVFGNSGFSTGWLSTDTPTAQNASGWSATATSLMNNGSGWTSSGSTFFYEIQASSSGGGVPLPGAAGLAACGLLGLSRRRRR